MKSNLLHPSSLIIQTFLERFDQFAGAPNAVEKMRRLVLDSAIQGKLVERRTSDGDGHSLLKKLRTLPPERNSKSRSPKDVTVEPETLLEIPSHWALTTVENTTRETGYFCDGDWVESKDQDPNGEVRLIQLADVGDGQYRDRSARFMTKAVAKRLNCSYLQAGDILVARMPDPLGRCCRFPGDTKPAVTVVDVCILRSNATFFDPDFVVVAINCPQFRGLVSAQATGTTRSRISRSNLSVLPIPLPPLAEQKRIVSKVNELMALCDRLEAQQQERETRHTALARASLSRFAEAPTTANLNFLFHKSYTIPPADLRRSILTLAVQGKLVPQKSARQVGSLESILAEASINGISKGPTSDTSATEILRISAGTSRGDFFVDEDDFKHVDLPSREIEKFRLMPGDLLACRFNGNLRFVGRFSFYRGTSGRVQVNPDKLIRFRINNALHSPRYICLAMNAAPIRKEIEEMCATTAGNIGLSAGKLKTVELPLPPLEQQCRIVAKVDQLMTLVDQLELHLATSSIAGEKLMETIVAELTRQKNDAPR